MIVVFDNVGVGTELSKRFYLEGFKVKKDCICGVTLEEDVKLEYPVVGYPEMMYFYCDECGEEYEDSVEVTVNISLEVNYCK